MKRASGVATKCSSRVAASGSQAHSFFVGGEKYTIFTDDQLSPVTDGDRVHFDYEVRHLKNRYRTEYTAVIQDSLVIDVPSEAGVNVAGEVYVLSNSSMKGLLKVGCTQDTALKRAAELSAVTGVPTRFHVEWSLAITGDPRAVEQRAHALLVSQRAGKEFFKVSLDEAKAAVIQSFVELYPDRASQMDEAFAKRAEAELTRRAELAAQAERRAQEKEEEEKRREFESSVEGRWLTEGTCRWVFRRFLSEPNRDHPSFFGKLAGKRYDDYLEFKVSPGPQEGIVVWGVSVQGRVSQRSIWKSEIVGSQEAALATMENWRIEYAVTNCSAAIAISNAMLETPPALPAGVQNPRYVYEVDSIVDVVIRVPSPRPRRSRYS